MLLHFFVSVYAGWSRVASSPNVLMRRGGNARQILLSLQPNHEALPVGRKRNLAHGFLLLLLAIL